MDWLQKTNAAVSYIEANLDAEIDLNTIGTIAGCSAYQFQRVFAYMANMSLTEYIRRHRLTRAAFDLQGGNTKVIDVAIKYSYDSPTSFTRAFSTLNGITLNEAKKDGASFVAYQPISFQITIQGIFLMNYRIETKEAFRVIGPRITTTLQGDQALKEIPKFWGKFSATGEIGQLCELMNTEFKGVFGLGFSESDNSENTFNYYIAVASTLDTLEDMHALTIPASTWAVFECTGPLPETIQHMQRQIYTATRQRL